MAAKRSKRQMARNIRRKVSGDIVAATIENEAKANAEVATSVQTLSETIEVWSSTTGDSLDELKMALMVIPETMRDFMRQQEKVFAELVHTSALLAAESDTETDPVKKAALLETAEKLRDRANAIHARIDTRPQSFKEAWVQRSMGLRPQDVRQKGIVRALFSNSKEILKSSFSKRKSTDDLIDDEYHAIKEGKATPRIGTSGESGMATSGDAIHKMDIGDVIDRARDARGGRGDPAKKMYNIRSGGGANMMQAARRSGRASARLTDSLLQSILGEVKAISRHMADKSRAGSPQSVPLTNAQAEIVKRERQMNITDSSFLGDLTPDRVAAERNSTTEASIDGSPGLAMRDKQSSASGAGDMMPIPVPNGLFSRMGRGVKKVAKGARGLGARALALAGPAAAVGGAAIAGLAIGDQFNTSIADGGSGKLKDVWDYNIGKSKIEKEADAKALAEAQKRGFASVSEWRASNQEKARMNAQSTSAAQIEGAMQRAASSESVERAQDATEKNIETKQLQQTAIMAAAVQQPVVQQVSTNTKSKGNPLENFIPAIRPVDNSFQRFQDKRNSRVL